MHHKLKGLLIGLSAAAGLMAPSSISAQSCQANEHALDTPTYQENFGTGSGRTSDPNVLNHTFKASGTIQDDSYAVGRSIDMGSRFARTAGDVDADGNTNGRYLFINMRGTNETPPIWEGEFYRQNNIPLSFTTAPSNATIAGFEFSTALVGSCAGCSDIPEFTLIVEDASDGSELARTTSASVGVVNDDVWGTATLVFDSNVPPTLSAVNLVLFNSQPEGDDGNDVGVDNITFAPRYCVPPELDLVKSLELVTNQVGDPTRLDAGDILRFTYTATNNGSVTAYNAAVTESLFQGAAGSIGPVTYLSGGADLDGGLGTPTDVAPGDAVLFTADYVILQDDITNSATITNLGLVTFEDLRGDSDNSESDNSSDGDNSGSDGSNPSGGSNNPTQFSFPPAVPELEMLKEADDDTFVTVGQVITYTYTVTNTGNEIIRNVAINDSHNGAGPAPTPRNEALSADNGALNDSTDSTADDGVWDVLAPGDVVTFTGTYTVQQADIDNLQ